MESIVRLGWLILRDVGVLFHLSIKAHIQAVLRSFGLRVCHKRVLVGLGKLAAIALIELN